MLISYLPVPVMVGFVSLLALAVLFISSLLRPKNPYREKLKPWECGLDLQGRQIKSFRTAISWDAG